MTVFHLALSLVLLGLSGQVPADAETPLRSHRDPVLDKQPIRVVRAEPFLRMGDQQLMTQDGYFLVVHEELAAIEAERYRLPTPGSTWKLTGRMGFLADGTIVAGFGTYLYWSRDEGRSWEGRLMDNLPGTAGPTNLRAFGVGREAVYVAHQLTAKPLLQIPGREVHDVAISRSVDLGETWQDSVALEPPAPYTFLAGDGNHIVQLDDGTLLCALDTANHYVDTHALEGWIAQVFFRSRDNGKAWGEISLVEDTAAEVGLLPMGGSKVMAAMPRRTQPSPWRQDRPAVRFPRRRTHLAQQAPAHMGLRSGPRRHRCFAWRWGGCSL